MIKVLINGAYGRMGSVTSEAVEQDAGLELVGRTSRQDDLQTAIETHQPQVVVDFTHAGVAFDNTKKIIDANVHPVIGTSGLLPDQIEHLQSLCRDKQLGGVIAPNFSIAAVLMMQLAATASKYLPQAEIIEMHHDGKKDSPSGTAIKTAEVIAANRQSSPQVREDLEILPGSRGAQCEAVPIHALRLPGYVASQSVIFGAPGERLTITHDSLNRECFMPGVLRACHGVVTLKELLYGLGPLL